MCKDKEHGGRCPSDTSEARRLRRKASNAASLSRRTKKNIGIITSDGSSSSIAELKTLSEALKAKIYAPVPNGYSQASWDSKIEKEVTALGLALGTEAEKLANYDEEAINTLTDAKMEELYSAQNKIVNKLSKEADKYYDQWNDILEKYKDNEDVKFGRYQQVFALTEEQENYMSDEEREFVKKYSEAENTFKIEQNKFVQIDEEYDTYKETLHAESNAKLALAYQEVLAQIRPLGGNIEYDSEHGDSEAQKIITNTVGLHYPSEWLQKHNEANGKEVMISFETDGRPSYSGGTHSETEDDGIVKQMNYTSHLNVETEDQMERMKKVFESDSSNKRLTVLKLKTWRGDPYYSIHAFSNAEEEYSEEAHGKLVDGKPDGEGWVYKASVASVKKLNEQNFEDSESAIKFLEKKVWVKPLTTTAKEVKQLTIFSPKTEKMIAERDKEPYDFNKATAYHEFGHRMEEVLPNKILPRLEKSFLARRTGKTKDNWYENMLETGSTQEYGHDAGMVVKYAARDYFRDDNYEVFTVGVESLYGGAYGGLVGNAKSYTKKDLDHRGFVLGVMASL